MTSFGHLHSMKFKGFAKSPISRRSQEAIIETDEYAYAKTHGMARELAPSIRQSCESFISMARLSRIDHLDTHQRDDYWLQKVDQLMKEKKRDKAVIK